MGTYGVEAPNAWPRSLHTRAVPGLFLERDQVGTWAQLSLLDQPEQSQSGPRVYASPPKAERRGTPSGLWGSSEERRSAGMSPSGWGSQGRRHSHPEPFLGHRIEGLSADGAGGMRLGELGGTVW